MTQDAIRKTSKMSPGRKKVGLYLLFGPTFFILIVFIVLGFINLVISRTQQQSATPYVEIFGQGGTIQTIINSLTVVLLGVGFIAWLPALIAGIIVLTTRKK